MKVRLETDRLILREVRKEDDEGFFRLDSNPEVHRYLGNNPVNTIEESRQMIEGILKQYKEHDLGRLSIIEKESNEYIGWSGLKREKKLRDFEYIDLGYRLQQRFWGKGYATEAALASLKYGFEVLSINKICAAADVQNLASNRILSKIGFIKKDPFVFEQTHCNWYELTKEEYGTD